MIKLLAAVAVGSSLASCAPAPADAVAETGEKAANTRILFIGNSHTGSGDVPGTVKGLMLSDGSGRTVYTESIFVAFLEDAGENAQIRQRVQSGNWDYVVCQGVKLSSSHNYVYPHDGAIKIAKLAADSGAKTFLFAEWPRKGWDETAYILSVYKEVSDAAGAPIIPTCRAWDIALSRYRNIDLWSPDGNHSSQLGAYLASCTIYFWLSEGKGDPAYAPSGLQSRDSVQMAKIAKETWEKFGKG